MWNQLIHRCFVCGIFNCSCLPSDLKDIPVFDGVNHPGDKIK